MDISSLPKYRPFQWGGSVQGADNEGQALFTRTTHIFLDLALLVAITAMLYLLRQMVTAIEHAPDPAPEPPPFDFRLVEERYPDIKGGDRAKVARLLGPPTEPDIRGEEIRDQEYDLTNFGREDLSTNLVWDKWTDPSNPDKWVLIVFYEGSAYRTGVFYRKWKNGF